MKKKSNSMILFVIAIAVIVATRSSSRSQVSTPRPSSVSAVSSSATSDADELVIPVGKGPGSIALADVNHDGHLDILVANTESETLSVLLGDGKGHFTTAPGSPFACGKSPNDIAVGDFNGDGEVVSADGARSAAAPRRLNHVDVVIANTGTPYLTILLGDGKGGFKPSPHSPFATTSSPHVHGVAVGDFNGDGKLDVVTDSWGHDQILMFTGDGSGNLNLPGRTFNVGKRPYQRLRSADFNKDGITDVVTTDLDQNAVTILLGDGHGGFTEPAGSPFAAGIFPWAVAIDDINKDGNLDLAVIPYDRDITNPKDLGVTVLLGDGKGGFRKMSGSPFSLMGCKGPDRVATGDLNGDGLRDIVVSCAQSNSLVFFMGTREGGFQISSKQLKEIGWSGLAVGDLNGDGKDDVVVSNSSSRTITILFGK